MDRVDGKLLRFCLVGTIGFLVDAGALLVFTKMLFWEYLSARVLSFLIACGVTWLLNRAYTFRSRSRSGLASLLSYVSATSIGALVNLMFYKLVVEQVGATAAGLLLGVAMGSVIALGFNFTVCRRYVFRQV